MSGSTATDVEDGRKSPDTWLWRCVGCGGTLYHDVELCRDCHSLERYRHAVGGYGETGRRPDAPRGFLDWMRRQPASVLSVKVSVVAGVELALTTLWLKLLVGSAWLGGTVPVGF
jgi:hypothetical protein